jgi:predicted anti-sigma-YlaC factor YlaD
LSSNLTVGRTECQKARERISLDLDGELSLHESGLLERHLSHCAECALFAGDVQRHTGLLRAAPWEEPPPFALPRRASARRFSVRVGATVASTAAAALVAVSVLSYGKPTDGHRVAALDFVPSGVVVARATNGLNGLRHPTAVQTPERPNLGLQDASQHGLVDN